VIIQPYEGLDALPRSLRFYGASDYATMEPKGGKKEPDFTEHGVLGIDRIGDFWFVDWWYKQCETDIGIAAFIKLVRLWKPIKWFNEGGLIDKAIGPSIRKEMSANSSFTVIEQLSSIQDKAVKLQAFHARAHAGTVHFPIKRKWSEHVMEQLIKFPGGRWDDAADVCGLLGRGIDQMVDARVPVAQPKPSLVPFTGKWLEHNDGSQTPKVRYF
jgi:predicted phage terminase large subunit-like protein